MVYVKFPNNILHSKMPAGAIRLYGFLSSHCIKDNTCCVSYERIKANMPLSQNRTIKNYIEKFDDNFIRVNRRYNNSNKYWVKPISKEFTFVDLPLIQDDKLSDMSFLFYLALATSYTTNGLRSAKKKEIMTLAGTQSRDTFCRAIKQLKELGYYKSIEENRYDLKFKLYHTSGRIHSNQIKPGAFFGRQIHLYDFCTTSYDFCNLSYDFPKTNYTTEVYSLIRSVHVNPDNTVQQEKDKVKYFPEGFLYSEERKENPVPTTPATPPAARSGRSAILKQYKVQFEYLYKKHELEDLLKYPVAGNIETRKPEETEAAQLNYKLFTDARKELVKNFMSYCKMTAGINVSQKSILWYATNEQKPYLAFIARLVQQEMGIDTKSFSRKKIRGNQKKIKSKRKIKELYNKFDALPREKRIEIRKYAAHEYKLADKSKIRNKKSIVKSMILEAMQGSIIYQRYQSMTEAERRKELTGSKQYQKARQTNMIKELEQKYNINIDNMNPMDLYGATYEDGTYDIEKLEKVMQSEA